MEDSYVLQLLKPKFKDFYLCFCGFAECKPLHSYGPATRPNYILHYVMEGKGIYQVGETKYQLKGGQVFLIEPESLTFYQADKKDPWSYLWVGFGGTEAQRFVRDLGLNSRQLTCECEYGEELKEIVFEMLRHTNSTAENLYYLQGKLYQFFSVLARGIEIQQYADDTKESIHVQEAIAYISHVSVVPNHQVFRNTPLHTRANVAYFGTFGYELDLNKLTEEEIKEVKEQITFMKEYREVLQFGRFYRLKSPFEGNETVWMVTNEDRTLAIVGYYRVLNGVNQPYSRVRLQGLNPDMVYENVWNHTENYGDELMNYGLITSDVTAGEVPGNVTPCTDFESRIYMLKGKKVQDGR